MLYVGIDQHARQLTVCVRDEAGSVALRRQVSTKPGKVEEFLQQLAELAAGDGYAVVLEVCGFNDWLLETLDRSTCRKVILVQPESKHRQKTDRRDAAQLSEVLWVNRHRLLAEERVRGLRQVQILTAEERDDRQLTSRRRALGQEMTRLINQVKHLLRRHNLQHDCPTKGIQTRRARAWLAQLPLSRIDRLEMDQLLDQWELFDKQIAAVQQLIEERVAGNQQVEITRTLPGAGSYSALGIACRVGNIERFPRPQSLANYFGLTPGCRNSGEATQRLGSITKQGSTMVRFLLGQLTMHALRKDAGLRQWYRRIRGRRGAKIARVAVMRRLACSLWHMLHECRPYEFEYTRARRRMHEGLAAEKACAV